MRTYLDCYPCFVRQALEAARFAGAEEDAQRSVLAQVLRALQGIDLTSTPPEIGRQVHRVVREELGVKDPYQQAKNQSTRRALELYPRLKALVEGASDPLGCAVRLAIAGNVIDFAISGAAASLDGLWRTVNQFQSQPLAIDHVDRLRRAHATARRTLYLADNAGETVFDRVLMESLGLPTLYVVKGSPILNDATREDAIAAGIDRVAEIVTNGGDAPGTIVAECPPALQREFACSDMIIAKGQANYETLSEWRSNLFFLLRAKCAVIARDLGVPVGSIVVK